MAELIRRRWEATYSGMSRKDRRGCDYDAYSPDPLAGWLPQLPADLVADLGDAETAVRTLDASGVAGSTYEGLARFLLRAESVASSMIEGLDVGSRRLLDAEIVQARGGAIADRVAVEVLANVAAMDAAIEVGAARDAITIEDLLAIHQVLMANSPTPELAGVVRSTQNWIGGSGMNPCNARFVPPPPELVPALLDDLLAYVSDDEHPALMQAAIAHAQFETIHPFGDGNGRTGRALIQVVLRRRGLAVRCVPPISLVLATWANRYVGGLMAFRYTWNEEKEPVRHGNQSVAAQSVERDAGACEWLSTFAAATSRACGDAARYVTSIEQVQARWRDELGTVRSGSAVKLLLEVLPGAPVVTVESAAHLIGRSTMRTGDAINRLVDGGVLRQRNVGQERYRVFEAIDVVELFTGLERALASPTGDTRTDQPNRPVPSRAR